MQGGGILELARQAAAKARTERAAWVAATRPVRSYRGVHQRKNRYYAVIWNTHAARLVWLGSYGTPEEAAYAYDAAARVLRGHGARTNFPEPAWAQEEVATDLVLAPPTPAREPAAAPAHRCLHQRQQLRVVAQASFDHWLAAGSAAAAQPQPQPQHQQRTPAAALFPHQQPPVPPPPFSQFFYLSGPATAAAVNPSVPGAYILTPQNVQMPPTNPATTALSSTELVVGASQSQPRYAAAPTQNRELPMSDQAVVGDNFSHGGASSSAAPSPVPRFTLDLLLQIDLPGRGGPGGAQ